MNVVNHLAVVNSAVSPFALSRLVVAMGLCTSLSVAAQSYQYENSIYYTQINRDTAPSQDYDNWGVTLDGVSYFQAVDTSRGPLAEAAFLRRASGVRLTYGRSETDSSFSSNNYEIQSEYKTDSGLLSIEYYIPNTIFYAGLGVVADKTETVTKVTSAGITDSSRDKDGWDYLGTAVLGVTPLDGWLVWTSFIEGQDVSDFWNIQSKYVWLLPAEQALNFQVSYAEADDDGFSSSSYALGVDYYINKSVSIGTAYSATDADDVDTEDVYELRVRTFFGDNVSAQASYSEADDDNYFRIGASYRF
ncbi:MAG: putative porin [Cellvibrio sp.]|uniref:putative porin n=1 Tax=Cellvibrio sp. TaxID=1965322 RepID=UPI0031A6EE8C